MKIIKGIGIYTLLILGALLIFAVLIAGCMFIFPNFDVFGWKIMFRSNQQVVNINTTELEVGKTYNVYIDAGVHNVSVYQFTDSTKFANIVKVDDMFGFYKGDYNDKLVYPENAETKKYNIYVNTASIDGAVLGRKSEIKVYLPNSSSYVLNIKTTTGNINIEGTGKSATNSVHDLNVTGLDVETTTGDFKWANINSTPVKVATGAGAEYKNELVDAIDTTAEGYSADNYARYVFLSKLNAKTKTGKFDFSLSNSDSKNTYIAPAVMGNDETVNFIDVITNGSKPAGLDNKIDNDKFGFYLSADRGDFTFNRIIATKLNIVGKDVLVRANEIATCKDFYFNVPNGYFEIENLNSIFTTTLNTIITNNINIDLENASGELSIVTTYGNINIGTLNQNASLTSTDGNIVVKQANASISAISEKGDITIEKYRSKGFLKNKSGKISATFDIAWYNTAELNKDNFQECMEVYNENASTTIKDAVFKTDILSGGGNLNVSYYEMRNIQKNSGTTPIEHKITVTGGSATVSVPNIAAFKFKGAGSISGNVGSVSISSTENNANAVEGYVQVLELAGGETATTLAKLNVNSTNATTNFTTYAH